jgi:hypothetical protein
VVLALKALPLSAPLGNRAGAMQTYVVKAAERVAVAHDHDRLVGDLGGEERAALA